MSGTGIFEGKTEEQAREQILAQVYGISQYPQYLHHKHRHHKSS